MKEYFSKWNWMRIAQLLVGILFLGNYYEEGGFLNLFLAGTLLIQSILNLGCFGNKGCSVPNNSIERSKNHLEKEVEFEEVL